LMRNLEIKMLRIGSVRWNSERSLPSSAVRKAKISKTFLMNRGKYTASKTRRTLSRKKVSSFTSTVSSAKRQGP
jgi:hypothetical protein